MWFHVLDERLVDFIATVKETVLYLYTYILLYDVSIVWHSIIICDCKAHTHILIFLTLWNFHKK